MADDMLLFPDEKPLGFDPQQWSAPPSDARIGAATRTALSIATPDQTAENRNWSRRLGVPEDVIARNRDHIRTEVATRAMQEVGRMSPGVAAALSDPAFTAIANDVPDEVSTFVKALKTPWKVAQSIGAGIGPSLLAGSYGLSGVITAPFSKNQADKFYSIARDLTDYSKRVADIDPNAGWFERAVYGGVQSFGQNIPGMAVGLATGGATLPLTLMGMTSAGTSALKGRDAGLSPLRNLGFATVDGVVEVATELLPTVTLLKGLKAGSPYFKLLLQNQFQEQWTEQIATHLQDFNAWSTIDRNKGATFGDYLAERPAAAAETIISTLVSSGGQVTVMKALDKVAHDRGVLQREAMDAELTGLNMENLTKAAAAGKIKARDNAAFGSFIDSVQAESGTAPAAVWVDPNVLMQTLEQAGVTPDEIKQAMPSVAEQLDDALETEHDIRIPLGEFMANLPGTGLDAALIPHLRTENTDGELSMTQDEAKTFLQSDQMPAFVKAAQKLLDEKKVDDAFTASRNVVEAELTAQMEKAGRFTKDVNQAYSTIMGAFYAVTAHRLGITPEAMLKQYPITIQSTTAKRANKLDQETDESKIVNPIDPNATDEEKLRQIHALSDVNEAPIQEWAKGLDAKLGTESKTSRKLDTMIVAKASRPVIIAAKPWHRIEHIRDAFRFKTVLSHIDQLPQAVAELKNLKGATIIKPDVAKVLQPKEWGWRIAAFDLRMPNGQIVEYYFPFTEMEAAKKQGGHGVFEKWRNEVFPILDPARLREYEADILESRTRYDAAWQRYLERTGSTEVEVRAALEKALIEASSLTGENDSANSSGPNQAPDFQTPLTNDAANPSSSTSTSPLSDLLTNIAGTSESNSLSQSVPLRAGKESLRKYGILPGKRHTTREIAMAFERRQADKYGKIDLKDYSPAAAARIAKWMADEVQFEMLHPEDSGVGWYSEKLQRAIDAAGDVFPELKTDQAARDIFTLTLATTSDGVEAHQNYKMALGVYSQHRAGLPLKLLMAEEKNPNIVTHLAKLQDYLSKHTPDELRVVMLAETTVQDANVVLRAKGMRAASNYLKGTKLPVSALVLGPKIGAFAANLLGAHGYLTMDRWWTRTFNRYRGQLTFTQDSAAPEHLFTVMDAMLEEHPSMEDPTDDQIREWVAPYVESAVKKRYKNLSPIENAANRVQATLGKTRDAPKTGAEREFMIRSANEAQQVLKRRGVEMSVADIQAVLWYYEKRLYPTFGARPSNTDSYEDAAEILIPKLVAEQAAGGELRSLRANDSVDDTGDDDSGGGGVDEDVDTDATATFDQSSLATGLDFPEHRTVTPAALADFSKGKVASVLGKSDWTILSAESPPGEEISVEEAADRTEQLRARLTELGVEHTEVKGKYGKDEVSFVVTGLNSQQALDLGREFGQESVLTRDGLIYQDGSVNPARKVTVFDTKPDDFYTTMPDGTMFQVDIDFDQRLALPADGSRIGSVEVAGVRFSSIRGRTVDGRHKPNRISGGEDKRVANATDKRIKDRINFYVDEGKGIKPESGVEQPQPHSVILSNLYDAGSDVLGIWAKAATTNDKESAVLDAGYSGHYSRGVFGAHGAATLLGDASHIVIVRPGLAEGFPLPPNETMSDAKQLALRVTQSKSLPSGALPVSQWDAIIKAVDPELHARLDEKGAFESDKPEPLYRDEFVKTFYQKMHHGTSADFDRFSTDEFGTGRGGGVHGWGMYFSEARDTAEGYAILQEDEGILYTVEVADSVVSKMIHKNHLLKDSPEAFAKIKAAPELMALLPKRGLGDMTGYDAYLRLSEKLGSDEEASKALARAGVTGLVVTDPDTRNDYKTTPGSKALEDWYEYVVFNDSDVSITSKEPVSASKKKQIRNRLLQGNEARGQITFADDITTKPTVITLLQKADLTTFLHEMGHFQLEVLSHIAKQPKAPQEIVDDMSTLLKWFGVKDQATWDAMTLEQKRPHHETYARGFEAYLFEGKSPNTALSGVFARFRAWMITVYKSLANLNVQLTPEVRGVFDRLVATNEEVVQAEQARGMITAIKSKPAGVSNAEWAAFTAAEQEATQDAVDKLQTRSVKDLKWAVGARAKAVKDLQAQALEKRKQVAAEVADEVLAEPIYAAMRFLRTGELPASGLTNAQRKALDAMSGMKLKLSLPVLKEMYGEGGAAQWRYLPQGTKNGVVAADGVSPEMVAELFGFTSGDHLVREMLAVEPAKSVIQGRTDQRMLERYGDLSSQEAINKAADEAVHNEARLKFVATELAMLEDATSITQPTGKKISYKNTKTGKMVEYIARANVFVQMAKLHARGMIAQKKIRDLKPNVYLAAESRAGKAAFEGSDPQKKMAAKRTQLINMQAYRAAVDAQREIERSLRYLKKVGDSDAIARDYRDQINALLERYDLRQVSLTDLDRRQSLLEWYNEQVAANPDNPPLIPEKLLAEAQRISYRDVSIEEFRGLVDTIKNIEHMGRLKSKLLAAKDTREFGAAVDKITTSIKDNAKGVVPERKHHAVTFVEKAKVGVSKFFAMHVKFANTLREMDGWKDNGVMYQMFGWGANKAAAAEAVSREQVSIKMHELTSMVTGKWTEKMYIPEVKDSFRREERIMIALNTGNAGNLQRLMDGDKWTLAQVQAVVDTLTKQEMDFVQSVWDYIGSFKGEIGAQQKRLTGVEPAWVEATPVHTKHGTYRGGYLPAKYNTDLSTRAMSNEALSNIMDMAHAARGKPKTRDSMTKARAEKVTDRPLRKDFGVVTQHLTEVTHRLAWQDYLYDSNRLLAAPAIDAAIREHYGADTLAEMRNALKDIADGEKGGQNAVERGLDYVRSGATIAGLGWRVTTSLLQPIGLTQSMVRIGPKWVGKGLMQWLGDATKMESTVANIYAKSDFMRLRSKTMQREISEIRNVVSDKNSAIEGSYFYLIQKMQTVADVPTWLGQYEKSVAAGLSEVDSIAQADQAVLDSQGGGQIKDLAAVQRGGPLMKLFTNFYSFFNTTYNLTRESVGRTDFKSAGSVGHLAVDMLLLYTVPAVLGTLLKAALTDKDEDEDKLLRKIIADQLNFLFGTVVLAREVGAAVNMALGLPANYSGPAGVRIFGELANLGKQLGQGEADEALFKAAAGTAGILFHLPSGQVASTLDGIHALATGKTEHPGALLVGSSKQ